MTNKSVIYNVPTLEAELKALDDQLGHAHAASVEAMEHLTGLKDRRAAVEAMLKVARRDQGIRTKPGDM